jgi:hypothetical protein
MPQVPFSKLPGHGRLWVFPLSRSLEATEAEACLSVVDSFLARWAAHGMPLRSARALLDDQFLLIGVDVDAEAPSGCSIDALVNQLKAMGQEMNVAFIDHSPVWYRTNGAVETATRGAFRELAKSGSVDAQTHVFDTSLTRVDQYRDGDLEREAAETWHGQAFFKAALPA